jgi:hypothetical protein
MTAILEGTKLTIFGLLKFASASESGVYIKLVFDNVEVDGHTPQAQFDVITGEYSYIVMDDGGYLDWLTPGNLEMRNGSIPGVIGQSHFDSDNYLSVCDGDFNIAAIKNIPADLRSMNPPDGHGVRSIGLFNSGDLTTKTNICGNLNPTYNL